MVHVVLRPKIDSTPMKIPHSRGAAGPIRFVLTIMHSPMHN